MGMFEQSSPLMQKAKVEVLRDGETVTIRLGGDTDLVMNYEHALDVAEWIREEATIIKTIINRKRRTLRSLGILQDADEKKKSLPYQGGVAIHSKPKLQDWKRSDVKSEGRLVAVTIGNQTLKLHHENALTLAQHIRVQAKQARNNAGDNRHWSEIVAKPIE